MRLTPYDAMTRPYSAVLFVSYMFPPQPAGGAVRAAAFAKYLPDYGWLPTVLTGGVSEHDRVRGHVTDDVSVPVRRVASVGPFADVRALKRGARSEGRKAALVRRLAPWAIPDRHAGWILPAFLEGKRLLRDSKHNVILATFGPPSNLVVGYALSRSTGLPLVVDMRDLWIGNPGFAFPTLGHRSLHESLERRILNHAAALVAVSKPMGAHLRARYGNKRIAIVPNGFDSGLTAEVNRCSEPAGFLLRYIGSIYGAQSLDPVLKAIAHLRGKGELREFHFQTIGNVDEALFSEFGLNDVCSARTYVSHAEALANAAGASALVVVETSEYVCRYGIAVKVFDYIQSRRPILAVTPEWSNTAELVRRTGAGIVADPSNPASIAKALAELMRGACQATAATAADTEEFLQYDRKRSTEKLAEVLDSSAATKGARWK